MGKTVKSRTIMSIASFLLVAAFCLVANTSVPKFYESYKQKEAAQQASTQAAQVIKKQAPTKQAASDDVSAPAEEPAADEDFSSDNEDANVYDIPEEPVVDEEPVEDDSTETDDADFDIDTDKDSSSEKEEKTSLLDKVLNFFKSLFEKISSFKLLGKLKDFFTKFLKLFGITI